MAILLMICVCGLFGIGESFYDIPSDKSFQASDIQKPPRNFSWANCESFHTPLTFLNVSITPHPLILTGENLHTNVTLFFNLTTELGGKGEQPELDISIKLKTDKGYTELCEVIDETICHYSNLCNHLSERTPFRCPIEPRMYPIKNLMIQHKSLPLLLRGIFNLSLFFKQQGKYIGCLELSLCVTECLFDD